METGNQSTRKQVGVMRARKHRSFLAILLILGFGIPGSIGIFAVQAKAFVDQSGYRDLIQGAATFTPTSTLQTVTPVLPAATGPASSGISTPSGALSSTLYAYIQAPTGVLSRPYVILRAFSTTPRSEAISIRGFIDSQEFICSNTSCVMYLDQSSRFVFRAYSDKGAVSDEVIASVTVIRVQAGFQVSIDTVSQFSTFTNSCSRAWGVSADNSVTWDDFVQFPYELNTNKTLHTLATELIINGAVDASDCPAGGLSIGLNWPTACGLEKARPKMIEWQNQYDEYIWSASKNYGVPPKIIKTLIEIESQFWPGNNRFYLDEYGLGQISQLGVDVLLRRDPTLYQQVCPSVLSDCSHPYISLEPEIQAMIRGAVISLTDATCPTCEYGLDLNKAKESVSLIALVLRANCEQVEVILNQSIRKEPDPDADAATATAAAAPTKKPDEDADAATATAAAATAAAGGSVSSEYEDMWRFTFAAYHSGLSCFQDAVIETKKNKEAVTWENVREELKCKSGRDYTDGFMDVLRSFDFYLYEMTDADIVIPVSTIVPTRTPVPSPTIAISTAQVRVQVFMDRNRNQAPDSGEWIDAMSVLLTTSSNDQITQRTQNGIAVFDMTGYPPGIGVNVSLPGLYRDQSFVLPAQGEVTVTFMFEQPALPTTIP
jgi:hypothetical protein